MSAYALSNELRTAIESLFGDPAVAYSSLGVGDGPADIYEPDVSTDTCIEDRLAKLRGKLESYLVQMAAESAELGCDETTDTLRMQAVGILIALREIRRHVPEIATG
jgi:hypothetical protein